MPKPPSKTAAAVRKEPPAAAVEALARELADRPYGEAKPTEEVPVKAMPAKAKAISISLPPCMIEKLEDTALTNKRSGSGPKTISGIVREALEAAGY
ncbi:hypothetical protein NAV31_18110 [Pseudomonas stutzeri]|nr:hypothetical protein [Stutzerimonas degradans]